ncbi:MAG: biopolymer transporter ExbD [Phycisphaerae bacterium]|nr:biopolymer transporter ExbD [Phycisphaerae bacterium]
MRFIRHADEHREYRLPLTSMIDVVFLLLIYFIITNTFTAPESRLSSALQAERQGPGQQADFSPQVVHVEMIEGEPGFRVGERVVRRQADLRDVVSRLRKESGVFVRVRSDVPVSAVAAALQACKDSGFAKVSYVPAR